MKFLQTILIIVLIYYAFKIVMRFLAPILIKKAAEQVSKKFEQKFNQQQQAYQQETTKKAEKTKPKKQLGEYIDYEEVK
jgi:hypothetical protein